MKSDDLGQQILSEQDLCELYLSNPNSVVKSALTDSLVEFDSNLELNDLPNLKVYSDPNLSKKDYDQQNQNIWFMPDKYKDFDIAKFVLDQCNNDAELQRAGEELLLYQQRNLFPLLRYLKYLVDTMRQRDIVWGVGRGSSVASFVLFLIGVHKINSLHYDLSIDEFLK